jgi:hypothetical protein
MLFKTKLKKFKMHKKGTFVWGEIVPAVLAAVIIIVLFFIFKDQVLDYFFPNVQLQRLAQSRQSCLLEMGKLDDDKDDFPDNVKRDGFICDLCLGGNDNLDEDGDYLPDECDPEPNNAFDRRKSSFEKECEKKSGASWDEEKERCVIT